MSYLIDENSASTASGALDTFETPPTATSVLKGQTVEVGPLGDPDSSDVDLCFEANGSNYIDGQNCYLHVKAKVTKADGTNIPATADCKIIPVTNFLHSLFATISLAYGNFQIDYLGNYPYVAYMENVLESGLSRKTTCDGAHGWISDDLGVFDKADVPNQKPTTVTKRKALISDSKTIDLCGRLNLSFLTQKNYIPPGAPLKIRLTRSPVEFCLMKTDDDATDYKIKISQCNLIVRQVGIHPSIVTAHNTLLASGEQMKFQVNRVDSQMHAIPAGQQQARVNVVINQQAPKRMYFAIINHTAKAGSYDHDPFNFKHYNLSSIGLEIDGSPVPSKAIKCNFDDHSWTHAYFNTFVAAGKAHSDSDHGITLSKFAKGYAIYGFDLTPDLCEGSGVHLIENKTITLDVTFRTPLPHTVSLFAFAERDDLVKISADRSVQKLSKL